MITVTGKSVTKPSNFLARIGTPMKQLIDACGGLPEDTGKVIGGGPMMGKALVNIEVPTAKGSSGILIMNQKEAKRGEAQTCIRCAKCVSACPMGLSRTCSELCPKTEILKQWKKKESWIVSSAVPVSSLVLPTVRCLITAAWVRVK